MGNENLERASKALSENTVRDLKQGMHRPIAKKKDIKQQSSGASKDIGQQRDKGNSNQ